MVNAEVAVDNNGLLSEL